jgi:hypothetical protein
MSSNNALSEIMTGEYLSVDELRELPMFSHLKTSTLAKWRQIGKGPKSVIIGGKPFYRRGAITEWLFEQERQHEHTTALGTMALQIQAGGQAVRGHDRLGGHQTKSQRRESYGGGTAD